ncbi:MAG: hypothetical protein OER86_04605 [Phycisphaerae bacterium]|nr:hypothetical protein [Phycisphaerae bacterium]
MRSASSIAGRQTTGMETASFTTAGVSDRRTAAPRIAARPAAHLGVQQCFLCGLFFE